MKANERSANYCIKAVLAIGCLVLVAITGVVIWSISMFSDMPDENEFFHGPRAHQWTRGQLRQRLGDWDQSPLAAAVSSVNRADHPWLISLLQEELRQAIQEERSDRAEGLAEAIAWCERNEREEVRGFCHDLARTPGLGQEIAARLLGSIGGTEDVGLLIQLSSGGSPSVAAAATKALEDLFGTADPDLVAGVDTSIPGSTSWLLQRIVASRRWPIRRGEPKPGDHYSELIECPEGSRVHLLRLALTSTELPVEEFPGEREIAVVGAWYYFLERWEHPDPQALFKSLGKQFPSALLELSILVQSSGDLEMQQQFWEALGGDHYRYEESILQQLHRSWIDFDMDEVTRYRFLRTSLRWDIPHRTTQNLDLVSSLDLERWQREDHRGFHHLC